MKVLYFGTWQKPGHYLWEPGMGARRLGIDSAELGLPWPRIDGVLDPQSEVEGEAFIHHEAGWTAIAFANRTDDERPRSNSAFFIEEIVDFDRAMEIIDDHFGHLLECWPFKVRLVEKSEALKDVRA